jgi:hypothetical protein
MFGLKEKLVTLISNFYEKNGIDATYASTLFILFAFTCHIKNFKNWANLSPTTKRLTMSVTYVAIITSIICILKLFGILKM